MNALTRVLVFLLFYLAGSKGLAFLGVGPTIQLIAGIVAGALAAIAIGDMMANSRRKKSPSAAQQGKWDR